MTSDRSARVPAQYVHPMRALAISVMLALGCSGSVSEAPPSDASVLDASADSSRDTALADTSLDTALADTSPDTALADTADTSPADTSLADSAASDTPVPDSGTALSVACAAAGGSLCTDMRWRICPKGFEPVSPTDHYGCGTYDGWCCRPAPPSACASSGLGNCLPTCPLDCWQPVTDPSLTCDGSRKCCRDVCK